MTSDKLILSAYGSHNAAISMFYQGKYWVVEVERWLSSKNQGLCNYMPVRNMQLVYDEIVEWLLSQTDRSDVDVYLTGYMNDKYIRPKFSYKQTLGCDHHTAHAACAFYQSPYDEALVITTDGGGDNSYFNFYLASRTKGIKLVDKYYYDLGFAYMILADYIDYIRKDPLTIGNLVYAGKLMGLCAYGKVRQEWLAFFETFYDRFIYQGDGYIGGAETRHSALNELMTNIGVTDFDLENSRYTGDFAKDLAATTQYAFEQKFYKHAQKHLDDYPNLPICLSGGCALNVLLNTRLAKERGGKVFVPPNPNDCGISAGMLLWYLQPETQVDLTYPGLPMMDENQLGFYLEDRIYSTVENVGLTDLGTYIAQGFIVGFIQGRSEHGPRALGNRSILCNPVGDMKDVLNHKVKNREWYRPFAPLVKLENASKYFEDFGATNSRHMTFVANVKDEWKEKLPAITHIDGTGRIQTITRGQNEAIYDLLTEFEKAAGHGVILNTSFNINGKPILTRFSDALELLKSTKLDAVYSYEHRLLIFKNGDEKRFKKSVDEGCNAQLLPETTVNMLAFAKDHTELLSFVPTIKKMSKKVQRLTIITEQQYARTLLDLFEHEPQVKVYSLDLTKHYYNSLITNNTKTGFEQYDRNSTYFFSLFIKPLWIKEVLRDNVFDTKYHIFIDLSLMDNYNYNVVRDIKNLIAFSKNDEEVIGMTALKEFNSIFDLEFLQKRFKFTPDFYPYPYIFYGNLEAVEWFSNNYEGMLRWWVNEKKVGQPADYCLASYAENRHRYQFLELEKPEKDNDGTD